MNNEQGKDLKNTPLFTTVIPSKLFECMGMGLPVLHGVAGESAEIVEKEGAGVVFEPENSDDLIEKLLELKNGECKSTAWEWDENNHSVGLRHYRASYRVSYQASYRVSYHVSCCGQQWQ